MKCASCPARRARVAGSATRASDTAEREGFLLPPKPRSGEGGSRADLIYFFADARDRDSAARPLQGGRGLRTGESAALRAAVVGGGVSAARRREKRRRPADVSPRGRGAGAADQASAA